jgi:hypothetical protein
MNNEGKIINKDASSNIYKYKDNGFPWSTESIEALEKKR